MSERSLDHPVWAVYELMCTSRLNRLYFARRAQSLSRLNFIIEWVVAAAASGSAVAALSIWNSGVGKAIWQILAVVAAAFAVAKPLLKLGDRVQACAEASRRSALIEHDLTGLTHRIRARMQFDTDLQKEFDSIHNQFREVVALPGELRTHEPTLDQCEQEVRDQVPARLFYVPAQ
jgi:hypothetical protein